MTAYSAEREVLRLFGERPLPRCGRCKAVEGDASFGGLWVCLDCADALLVAWVAARTATE